MDAWEADIGSFRTGLKNPRKSLRAKPRAVRRSCNEGGWGEAKQSDLSSAIKGRLRRQKTPRNDHLLALEVWPKTSSEQLSQTIFMRAFHAHTTVIAGPVMSLHGDPASDSQRSGFRIKSGMTRCASCRARTRHLILSGADSGSPCGSVTGRASPE